MRFVSYPRGSNELPEQFSVKGATNTGEKYITHCWRKKKMRYRVRIKVGIINEDREFRTLNEAKAFRNSVIRPSTTGYAWVPRKIKY